MQWNPITQSCQIEDIKAASFTKPQLILKHSTTCSISKMALARLERAVTPSQIDFHYLDLLNFKFMHFIYSPIIFNILYNLYRKIIFYK